MPSATISACTWLVTRRQQLSHAHRGCSRLLLHKNRYYEAPNCCSNPGPGHGRHAAHELLVQSHHDKILLDGWMHMLTVAGIIGFASFYPGFAFSRLLGCVYACYVLLLADPDFFRLRYCHAVYGSLTHASRALLLTRRLLQGSVVVPKPSWVSIKDTARLDRFLNDSVLVASSSSGGSGGSSGTGSGLRGDGDSASVSNTDVGGVDTGASESNV
jgi:hypothetical protein